MCREKTRQKYTHMLILVISGVMVNFIFFSIFLSALIFLHLAYIIFISRENIAIIVLKEEEIIFSRKHLATG